MRVSLLEEDVLRRANALSFGREQLPTFDLAHSRFVLAFGADFLGTWNSPVAQGVGIRRDAPGHARRARHARAGRVAHVADRRQRRRLGARARGDRGRIGAGIRSRHHARAAWPTAASAGRAGAVVEGWAAGLPQFTPALVERTPASPPRGSRSWRASFARSPRAVAIIGGAALSQTNGARSGAGRQCAQRARRQRRRARAVSSSRPRCRGPARESQPARALPGGEQVRGRTLAALAAEILAAPASPIEAVLLDDANPVFHVAKARGACGKRWNACRSSPASRAFSTRRASSPI